VNLILDALSETKQNSDILVHIRYLNGTVICPWSFLKDAPKLTPQNYDPSGGTPLYDESGVSLGAVIAKTQEFSDNGVHVRSISCIVTDGADAGSRLLTAAKVKPIVLDMLKGENHIVAGMGISDGITDFKQVFRDMGLDDKWILTPSNDKHDIRAKFQTVSQTVRRRIAFCSRLRFFIVLNELDRSLQLRTVQVWSRSQ